MSKILLIDDFSWERGDGCSIQWSSDYNDEGNKLIISLAITISDHNEYELWFKYTVDLINKDGDVTTLYDDEAFNFQNILADINEDLEGRINDLYFTNDLKLKFTLKEFLGKIGE